MEGASKFFAWLNRILCWLLIAVVIILSIVLTFQYSPFCLSLLFVLIILIPSALMSRKMINSIDENDKEVWIGVLGIFLVGVLPGIFYLCWQPYSYTSSPKSSSNYTSTSFFSKQSTTVPANTSIKKIETTLVKPEYALLEIQKLYDLGILNEEQYKNKVEKYKKLI